MLCFSFSYVCIFYCLWSEPHCLPDSPLFNLQALIPEPCSLWCLETLQTSLHRVSWWAHGASPVLRVNHAGHSFVLLMGIIIVFSSGRQGLCHSILKPPAPYGVSSSQKVLVRWRTTELRLEIGNHGKKDEQGPLVRLDPEIKTKGQDCYLQMFLRHPGCGST